MNVDQLKIRKEFPILQTSMNGKPLVYLDNAATSQKPKVLIEKISEYYQKQNSNIHRGIYALSNSATVQYENSRKIIQEFIHAKLSSEIIFTRGTTESINLVAYSYGISHLKEGDEIVITQMEHHSNIVPWQIISKLIKAKIKYIPINKNGELQIEKIASILSEKTKLVAVTHVSNAIGTVNPIEHIIQKSHELGAIVLVDGAQAVKHFPIDVQKMDCDFYCFSGHKMYGPTGIGILYGKKELLERMSPFHGGGEMIKKVTLEKSTYASVPAKFEAGTPNIVGAIAMSYAVDFIKQIGYSYIQQHERSLLEYSKNRLLSIPNLSIIGDPNEKSGLHSFIIKNVHPHDIATLLDQEGIAIRAGHHCAQPIIDFFDIVATSRISFAIYNTKEEIDIFLIGLKKAVRLLSKL